MSAISVAEVRSHLNLDHDLDDAMLAQMVEAAEAYIAAFMGKPVPDPIPADLRLAVLMLAALWYENREAASTMGSPTVIPFGVADLLQAHRAWTV